MEQELVQQHVDYARALARQIHKTLPPHVNYDDLSGYAMIGLAEAAQDYDPAEGVAFTSFAFYRVRGAVFDGIRKMSWTRRQRKRIRAEAGVNAVQSERPTVQPGTTSAEDAGLEVDRAIRAAGNIYLLSQAAEDDRPVDPVDNDETPAERAENAELLARLRVMLPKLPKDQAQLLQMLYFENLTMTEVAQRLGKHKSNVSRAHEKAIGALQTLMAG